jgi:hypothetical protein
VAKQFGFGSLKRIIALVIFLGFAVIMLATTVGAVTYNGDCVIGGTEELCPFCSLLVLKQKISEQLGAILVIAVLYVAILMFTSQKRARICVPCAFGTDLIGSRVRINA